MHKYLPAGSAVGTQGGPLTITFLAARTPNGQHIENPRQISAYKYPKRYGQQSPSFARATYQEWKGNKYLYVAGTASIVGHQSIHFNNPLGQLEETIRNIETILEDERLRFENEAPKIKFEDAHILKTYIRDKKTYPVIRSKMEEKLIDPRSNLYLWGDICRKELLLEIEGVWLINDPLDFLEKNKPDMKPEKSKKIRVLQQ
jgi:chorismate lyase/3-hydroxybenzoate synthase